MAIITVGPGKDYTTITAAVVASRVGTRYDFDTIEIYNGTYTENVTDNNSHYLTIKAAAGQTPIMDGEHTTINAFVHGALTGMWTIEKSFY